jgi:hypothetical protein
MKHFATVLLLTFLPLAQAQKNELTTDETLAR